MATKDSRLAEIFEYQRRQGRGTIGALGSTLGGRALEKLDVRNLLFGPAGTPAKSLSRQIGRSLFGSGYSAAPSRKRLSEFGYERESLSNAKVERLLSTINQNMSSMNSKMTILAKNSIQQNRMARDMNVIRQNVVLLTKKELGNARTKADMYFMRSKQREMEYERQLRRNDERESVDPSKSEKSSTKKGSTGSFLKKGLKSALAIGGLVALLGNLDKIIEVFKKAGTYINSIWNQAKSLIESLKNFNFKELVDAIKNFDFKKLTDSLKNLDFKNLSKSLSKFGELLNSLKNLDINKMIESLKNFDLSKAVDDWAKSLDKDKIGKWIGGLLESILKGLVAAKDFLKGVIEKIPDKALGDIFVGLAGVFWDTMKFVGKTVLRGLETLSPEQLGVVAGASAIYGLLFGGGPLGIGLVGVLIKKVFDRVMKRIAEKSFAKTIGDAVGGSLGSLDGVMNCCCDGMPEPGGRKRRRGPRGKTSRGSRNTNRRTAPRGQPKPTQKTGQPKPTQKTEQPKPKNTPKRKPKPDSPPKGKPVDSLARKQALKKLLTRMGVTSVAGLAAAGGFAVLAADLAIVGWTAYEVGSLLNEEFGISEKLVDLVEPEVVDYSEKLKNVDLETYQPVDENEKRYVAEVLAARRRRAEAAKQTKRKNANAVAGSGGWRPQQTGATGTINFSTPQQKKKAPSSSKENLSSGNYKMIAGVPVVEGMPLTEEQKIAIQIKNEMRGASKAPSSAPPKPKVVPVSSNENAQTSSNVLRTQNTPSGLPNNFDYDTYTKRVGYFESSNDYGIVNSLGYVGRYQFGAQALETLGYLKPGSYAKGKNASMNDPSNWNNGLSLEKFLNSPEIQDEAMEKLTKLNYKQLADKGVINKDMSSDELAGMLYVAHGVGAGGAMKFARGENPAEGYGTTARQMFAKASGKQYSGDDIKQFTISSGGVSTMNRLASSMPKVSGDMFNLPSSDKLGDFGNAIINVINNNMAKAEQATSEALSSIDMDSVKDMFNPMIARATYGFTL